MSETPPHVLTPSLAADALQSSFFLKPFKGLTQVIYRGETLPKVTRYSAVNRDGETMAFWVQNIVASVDDALWESARMMLEQGIKLAAGQVQGFFGFECVAADLASGVRHFSLNDFAALIANHARKLEPGESKVIQYGGFFGVLQKRIREDWGKIDAKYFISICRADPPRPDLLFKKMLERVSDQTPAILVLADCGLSPAFRFDDELQRQSMQLFFKKCKLPLSEIRFIHIYQQQLTELTAPPV